MGSALLAAARKELEDALKAAELRLQAELEKLGRETARAASPSRLAPIDFTSRLLQQNLEEIIESASEVAERAARSGRWSNEAWRAWQGFAEEGLTRATERHREHMALLGDRLGYGIPRFPPGLVSLLPALERRLEQARQRVNAASGEEHSKSSVPCLDLSRDQPGTAFRVDCLVVTALLEECDAVQSVSEGAIDGGSWARAPSVSGLEFFVRSFRAEDGGILRIGVTRSFGMGGEQAVTAASALLSGLAGIRCLAMCGVCAGKRGDVNLGDVIIADRAWHYDDGKVKAWVENGARAEQFQGDMNLYRIHPPAWKQYAERFCPQPESGWIAERPLSYECQALWLLSLLAADSDPITHPDRRQLCPNFSEVVDRLWKVGWLVEGDVRLTDVGRQHIAKWMRQHPDGLETPPPFKVVVGPIATGAPVVEDPTLFERLAATQGMRKVLGLEMESAAILGLAYLARLPFTVVMKGVMDHADRFKSDNMKSFAARASAECLIAFLRRHLPSEDFTI